MTDVAANSALQASIIYVALLVIGLVPLTLAVIRLRRGKRIGIGDGGNKELAKAIRVHANYAENTPFGLALLLALPLVATPAWAVHVVGLSLLVGRTAHAIGLNQSTGSSLGRVLGMVLTQMALLFGAVLLLWGALF